MAITGKCDNQIEDEARHGDVHSIAEYGPDIEAVGENREQQKGDGSQALHNDPGANSHGVLLAFDGAPEQADEYAVDEQGVQQSRDVRERNGGSVGGSLSKSRWR